MTKWALDLFAGPGGWDVHDHDLGITTLRVENDDSARATATAAGFVHTHDDVTTYRIDRWYDGLKASPPCPTFSPAGNGSGRKQIGTVIEQLHRIASGHPIDYAHYEDTRTGLVLEPLRVILEAFYLGWPFRWIAMEQVPAVLPVWDEYAKILAPLGYSVATGNLQAEQYGVPQTRKRCVLVARLDGDAKLPTPTHEEEPRTMLDEIGRGLPCPSPTITGGGTDTGGAEPVTHWRDRWTNRADWQGSTDRLTVAECAALQSFPEGYPWQGTKSKQYQQVGNAIPPLLAVAILRESI